MASKKITARSLNRHQDRPDLDKKFRKLESILPREALSEILDAAQDDPRALILAALINNPDPQIRRMTLPTLCKKAGIGYADFLKLVTDTRLAEGMVRASEHMPQAIEDTAIDAKSKIITCPHCKGKKQVADTDEDDKKIMGEDGSPVLVPCWSCDGTGKLRKPGDPDARTTALRMFKLIDSRGALVNVDLRGNAPAAVEDELERASRIITVRPQLGDGGGDEK